MEAKDREEEYKKLDEGLKDKFELRKKSPKKVTFSRKIYNFFQGGETGANKFADSEEREKLIEKFASLLENKVSNPIQNHIKNYL